MNKNHALLISLVVGAAAIAGTVAATKSAHLGRQAATTPTAPSALIVNRSKSLARTEAALMKAMKQRPPKLPAVPKAMPAVTPAGGAPIAAAAAAAPAQRVVYVRPAPIIRHIPRPGGGEHESEGGSQQDGGGGGFDDVTSTARLYALAGAVLVFFVAWAAIAAHPWQTQKAAVQDPKLAALQVREQRIRAEALAVKRVVDKRWAVYRTQLAARKREIAAVQAANARNASLASARATYSAPSAGGSAVAAPSVRIITLPPLTITRTS